MLEDIAFRRGIPCGGEFIAQSFPFSLFAASPLWSALSAVKASELFHELVILPLAAKYLQAAACAV